MEGHIDEFEKRMHFSAIVATLADTVTRMNPTSLVGRDARELVESAGLKDKMNQAVNKWLDMCIIFTEKATTLGNHYPIEELLGITVGTKPEVKV